MNFIPSAMASLPVRHHSEYGPLLLNRDVAKMFGVGPSTLRRRRARGRFPVPVIQEPTASWYRLDDIVQAYQEITEKNFFSHKPLEGAGQTLLEGVTQGISRRDPDVLLRNSQSPLNAAEIGQIIRDTLTDLMEYEPEDPAINQKLTETIVSQQRVIASLQSEVDRLRQLFNDLDRRH